MDKDHETPPDHDWSAHAPVGEADLAAHLRRVAQPFLYNALMQRALIQTVREFPAAAALAELARAVAEDALRRALRLVGGAQAYDVEAGSPRRWQVAYDRALDDLAEMAERELLRVRTSPARPVH